MRLPAVLLSVLLLEACALTTAQLESHRETVKMEPEPYQTGYMDGCESGMSTALIGPTAGLKFRRSETRMKDEPEYATGWRIGRAHCAPP